MESGIILLCDCTTKTKYNTNDKRDKYVSTKKFNDNINSRTVT